ncbi:helix-turn-helix domain-containing protein [Fimbriimonas ginsengisoli]|uniref:Transcriptional regulator, AraC family n=1 Tax=Fimbriimonas ginsengisoli Gsoil 348 TaxID=661478 RepID=A0A068NJL2_FIMGI|nr:AraC family transcriptional regulator [Fimbriimonas ginsengisoli]AIE83691.1 transcriptional regulator, AraC family [Fimbriimonas ginsengisoli Gsoil 348]
MATSEKRSLAQYEQRLNDVLDYVEQNFDSPLPLERLADIAHFSPFHFHRLFKAYVGEAPHTFLRRLRLQKAIGLMEGKRRTLAEIAVECGFAWTPNGRTIPTPEGSPELSRGSQTRGETP